MNDRVRVWCLRHAESENVTNGVAGAVPAAPLTARGRRQAAAAGHLLAAEPIVRVYSGPAVRARETARLLAAPGAGVTTLPELAEVGIGEHEGSRDAAVRARTAEVLRAWVAERDLAQRVADGESGQEVVARMTAALLRIAAAHAGETVALVGHVASLTVAVSRLCALGAGVWGTPLPHAHPFLIERRGERWTCPAWPVTPGRPPG
ncbi:histidine phosphatase family protein [Spirillospora sp. NPDC047418]